VKRFFRQLRARWPPYPLWPPLPFIGYALVMAALGELRWDHVVLALLIALLAYSNERTRDFCIGAYPIALTAIVYGSMRYIKSLGVTPARIHLCDLRDIELRLFGVTVNGERITLQDWFRAHPCTALDLYCAIPYATFLIACVICAITLYLRDPPALPRFAWGFFVLNIAGFITYHVYPAAPPWYFHAYGCQVDILAPSRPGPPLERVDALLGIAYFHGMYGRASDVFGAVPSLHVAYPLMILIEGWKSFRWAGRALSLVFLPSMCFAAVYLDHHWVVDVVLGLLYSLLICGLIRLAGRPLLASAPAGDAARQDRDGQRSPFR
jgi:inositol phosphorylceramide synthase catalytic subunit